MTELVMLASGYQILEAPRPDLDGSVWFSDLTGGVHRRTDAGDVEVVVPRRRSVGGIAIHADGGAVVTGRSVCHVTATGSRDVLAVDGVVFNDLACDDRGRVWVGGSSSVDDRRTGSVYRVDERGASVVLDDLGIPNGIGFSPDGRRIYVVDSATRHVLTAEIDGDTVRNVEIWVDLSRGAEAEFGFPPSLPTPDGLAVDEDGGVWIAILGGDRIQRFTSNGHADVAIDVPGLVTSVAFGTLDPHALYITTGIDAAGRGGCLLVTHVHAPGQPNPLARI